MRLLGWLVVIALVASCSRWEPAKPSEVAQSKEWPSHVLVVTSDRAYELTDVIGDDTRVHGTPVHGWRISSVALDGHVLDDLEPAQLAQLFGWQPLTAPPQVELETSTIRAMRVYSEQRGASAAVGVGGVLGSVAFALFIAISTIPAASCGRPLRVRGKHHITPLATGTAWIEPLSVAAVEESARGALIEIWTEEAQAEHAAVAAFSKLSLELLAVGAPPDLVERANRAAMQEVRHARLCFGLASAYTGRQLAPAPLPEALAGDTPDLDRLARESLVDGCLREGLAAEIARIGATTARDPVVVEVLQIQAEEEAQHAELGWAIVEWCLAQRGEPLRAMLVRSIGDMKLPRGDDLPEHGRVPRRVIAELLADLREQTRQRLDVGYRLRRRRAEKPGPSQPAPTDTRC